MPDDNSPQKRGAMGGLARAQNLPDGRRSQIAKDAAVARWGQSFPHALCEGIINFNGREVACAVLDTKLRVLTQETFLTTMGRAGKAKGGQGSRRLAQESGLPPLRARKP